MTTPTFEEFTEYMDRQFPDDAFKDSTETSVRLLLPTIGDNGVLPHLMVTLITETRHSYDVTMVGITVEDFNNFDIRKKVLFKIGETFALRGHRAVAVYMSSEAWVSSAVDNGEPKYATAGEDPQRVEKIIVAGKTIDHRSMLTVVDFERDNDGNILTIGGQQTDYDFKREGTIGTTLLDCFWKGFATAQLTTMKNQPNSHTRH